MGASGTNDVTFPPFSFLPVEDYLVLRDRCMGVSGSDWERGRAYSDSCGGCSSSLGAETVVRLEQVKMMTAKSKKDTTRKRSSRTY
jgi:hypothetical protein